ncbi:vWA domain-containing protein [Streptomyces albidoflavus]|uniref:vWA domain-containing protein n=1 Tax=Streptomyces albidoflavus TaxID=1886 RepID=UPI001C48768E|nr:vWA domain-containing protein [Streptomyces albidoflavus]MBV7652956.1 VWA domain-containing protein [Streptomyces albidoflavus]MBV7708462.1 VWA domain-containing protein [Streptomyces albidoflavus]
MKPHTRPPRGTTAPRRRAAVAAVLLAATAVLTAPAAAAEGPSREEIYRELGVADQPVDYAVLVDTSGSMRTKGRYDTVRSTLRGFLGGLSRSDHVALITFDDRPEARYVGSAGDPGKIVGRLPKSPDPDGGTDIGAALDLALRELERSDAASVASVVMLTDGRHEPPRSTAYPKASGAPWDALHRRAEAVGTRAGLAGYALPLGSGASGADQLGKVVRDTMVLRPGSIQDLGAYLRRAGDSTRARSAARLLAEDRGKGVTASWRPGGTRDLTTGSAEAAVTFRSAAAHTPLTVTGTRLTTDGVPLRVSGVPDRLTLAPGESRTYTVRLAGGVGGDGLPFRRTEEGAAALRVSGKVASPWQRALAPDVELRTPGTVAVRGRPLTARAETGSVLFLPALLLGVAAVLALGWLRWRSVHRPSLSGGLGIAPVFAADTPGWIALSGRRVAFQQPAGGRGTVHGRRRRTPEGPRVDLLIRYAREGAGGRPDRVTCAPGAKAVVGGLAFTHRPDGPPADGHAPEGSG